MSQEVEDQCQDVLTRPKFGRFVDLRRRLRVLDVVLVAAKRVDPVDRVRECSDPKDDKYLSLAAAGGAT